MKRNHFMDRRRISQAGKRRGLGPSAVLAAAILSAVTLVSAQRMNVYIKGESEPRSFPVSSIDSIRFSSEAETPQPGHSDLVYPADLLDLGNWKVTLPIGDSKSPKEVKQPELAKYKHDDYFRLTGDGKGILFRSNVGGVTTSGSGYPRSELREMRDGGKERASWSTTSGTHTMFLKMAITHLPAVKSHLVAGQIHGGDDDVIVIRLEGKKLFVDHNGDDGPVLNSNYVLGTVFTVKFVASSGRVKIYYNGSTTPSDDYQVSDSSCYFKVGAYTQSNPSKGDDPDDYGEVILHELEVTHK